MRKFNFLFIYTLMCIFVKFESIKLYLNNSYIAANNVHYNGHPAVIITIPAVPSYLKFVMLFINSNIFTSEIPIVTYLILLIIP
jgi:hypothetical protein